MKSVVHFDQNFKKVFCIHTNLKNAGYGRKFVSHKRALSLPPVMERAGTENLH